MFFGTEGLMAGLSEASRIMTELVTEKNNLIDKNKQQELVISEQKKRIEELLAAKEALRSALHTAEINNCKLGFKVLATTNYGDQRAQILEMSKTIQAQAKEIADRADIRGKYFKLRATVRGTLYLLKEASYYSNIVAEARNTLKVAIGFAMDEPEADQKPTLRRNGLGPQQPAGGYKYYCDILNDAQQP